MKANLREGDLAASKPCSGDGLPPIPQEVLTVMNNQPLNNLRNFTDEVNNSLASAPLNGTNH